MTGAALSGKKYKAYPEYKESGVEWVGEIPSDWCMWKLAHAFNEIGSGTTPPTNNEKWFKGDVPWITTGELREKIITDTKKKLSPSTLKAFPTLKKYPVGSIAIAMYGATIGRLGIFGVEAATNQACCVMTTSTQLNNKYLFYWLWAFKEDIIRLSSGGGQPNINQEKVASLRVSAPKSKEQQKIANFLDYETAKIDTLIAKQEKLIELLKEKRQAVISHAVTKGLNPNAPMRDSGVEWLGEVPKHWVVAGFKKFIEKIVDYRGKTPNKTDSGVFLVTARNIKKGVVDYSLSNEFISEDDYSETMSRGKPNIGDVLFTTEAPLGEVANVDNTDIALAQRIIKFSGKKDILDNYFFKYFMMSEAFQTSLSLYASGSTVKGIKAERLVYLRKLIPPLAEQKEITHHIDIELKKFDLLVSKAEVGIELIKERKTALISAAVTGKIDLRDWKSQGI